MGKLPSVRHWIDSAILDVGDQADGMVLVFVHCATHERNEWHWIDAPTFEAINAWGAEPGWLWTSP